MNEVNNAENSLLTFCTVKQGYKTTKRERANSDFAQVASVN